MCALGINYPGLRRDSGRGVDGSAFEYKERGGEMKVGGEGKSTCIKGSTGGGGVNVNMRIGCSPPMERKAAEPVSICITMRVCRFNQMYL